MQLKYKPPGPVARDFMLSDKFVRGLRGPIGSGKSATCVMEVFRRITQQAPNPEDGKRRSRWAIIRNTNPQLRTTTIKTWQDWLPEKHCGAIAMHPPPFTQWMRFNDVEAEILFLALDSPDDVRKLLSLELTGAWINEAREVPKSIVDGVTSRLRRYPALKDGGASWSGLIMDTNSPDDDHWWPIMAGESPPPESMTAEEQLMLVKPANWEFFTQPAAMFEQREGGRVVGYVVNREAENIRNLHKDYYPELVQGKTRNWINVYVRNQIGADFDGKKVHPDFVKEVHVTDDGIEVAPGHTIIGGVDFGLTPACIFWQFVMGQWRCLGEIVMDNADAGQLADEIVRYKARRFPDNQLIIYGDPSGDNRVGTDKNTPFAVLRAKGLQARPTDTNDPEIRRASLSNPMKRMVNGQPGLLIDGKMAPIFVKGLDGGWHYARIRTSTGEKYANDPEKNRYSHPCEAGEYGVQGGGEGRRAQGRDPKTGKQSNGRVERDPLARLQRTRQTRPTLGVSFR